MANKEQAEKEYRELLSWEREESNKVTERLKKEGKLVGLDTHQEEYAYIREIRNKKIKEIQEKYKL